MILKIDKLETSPFSYEEVANLMHLSFEERLAQGLQFTCSSMTASQFRKKTEKGIVLVAWDTESTSLLGTATVSIRKDKKGIVYGYNEYLAIHPSAKRLGLGTRLLEERIIVIIRAGGQYVISDTAVGADSSVKWHLKNGFKIVGLKSYLSTNYYSYLFRKQLTPSRIWDNSLYVWLVYSKSALFTRVWQKADGTPTIVHKVIKGIAK